MLVGCVDLELDFRRRLVLYRGKTVPVSRKAFDLLEILVRNRDRVLSKAELHDVLWPDTFVAEVNVSNLVSEIRRAVGDDPREPRVIRTVHGVGYAFCGEITNVAGDDRGDRQAAVACWLLCGDQRVALAEGEHLIGRSPKSVLLVDSRSVSRNHALVAVARSGITIVDIGSTNGTYVGRERIACSGSSWRSCVRGGRREGSA
jgi:DNA-binding winged helix-turn-helix (wHTH) protein